jgi:hypothetical protein
MDLMNRVRYARDLAAQAEETEKERLAEAKTAELQQAASVRLAARQAVREALDDLIRGPGDQDVADGAGAATATAGGGAEDSYAGAGTPADDSTDQAEDG